MNIFLEDKYDLSLFFSYDILIPAQNLIFYSRALDFV